MSDESGNSSDPVTDDRPCSSDPTWNPFLDTLTLDSREPVYPGEASVDYVVSKILDHLNDKVWTGPGGAFNLQGALEEGIKFIERKSSEWFPNSADAGIRKGILLDKLPNLVASCMEGTLLVELKGDLHEWGFTSFELAKSFLRDSLTLLVEFDLNQPRRGENWVFGSELCARWNITPREMMVYAKRLPVFLFSRISNSWIRITDRIPEPEVVDNFHEDPQGWINLHSTIPMLRFTVPDWWQLEIEYVEFFQNLEGLVSAELSADKILEFWTPDEVVERWGITMKELEGFVLVHGLAVHRLDSENGVVRDVDPRDTSWSPVDRRGKTRCLFKLAEIEEFRKKHRDLFKTETKTRINLFTEYRMDARKLVKVWLLPDPNLTKQQVINRLQETHLFNVEPDTLWEYVKDLMPKQKAGRPRRA